MSYKYLEAEALRGLTILHVKVSFPVGHPKYCYRTSDESVLLQTFGRSFRIHHNQACCESVQLASITGDLNHLIGSPILDAEKRIETSEWPADLDKENFFVEESFTITSVIITTALGTVCIRWVGTSNRWYGESVDLEELT